MSGFVLLQNSISVSFCHVCVKPLLFLCFVFFLRKTVVHIVFNLVIHIKVFIGQNASLILFIHPEIGFIVESLAT